jgi:hypothetical protein
LHGRQSGVPNAGDCCLIFGDSKMCVTRIIAVVELILKSISPVFQLVDAPLQDLVKRRWRFQIFNRLTFSPTFVLAELPATTSPSFAFKSIAQLRYLTFWIVYIPDGRAIVCG